MKKLFTSLAILGALFLTSSAIFANECNCNCASSEAPKCNCAQNCDCGCQKGEKCKCENCNKEEVSKCDCDANSDCKCTTKKFGIFRKNKCNCAK